MNRLPVFPMAFAAFLAASAAETAPVKGMLNPNAPIDVTADAFTADANAKTGVYTGNVVIHQGEVRMRANTVRAHIVENKPDRIFATGHVVVDAPSGVATGDNGVYEVNPRLITLTGNVVLTKDKNVMRGQQLVVNLITGQAVLDGGPATEQGQGKRRVQALFSTTEKNKQNP